MKNIVIVDTSVLCCYLRIPFMETCGDEGHRWDPSIAKQALDEAARTSQIILPVAVIIETGNHIAHASKLRYEKAKDLADLVVKSANGEIPWVPFITQLEQWGTGDLANLASGWPTEAAKGLSIGDMTIVQIADYYRKVGATVKILSGDEHLCNYQPTEVITPPQRRKKQFK